MRQCRGLETMAELLVDRERWPDGDLGWSPPGRCGEGRVGGGWGGGGEAVCCGGGGRRIGDGGLVDGFFLSKYSNYQRNLCFICLNACMDVCMNGSMNGSMNTSIICMYICLYSRSSCILFMFMSM